jgi:hypothetical protein
MTAVSICHPTFSCRILTHACIRCSVAGSIGHNPAHIGYARSLDCVDAPSQKIERCSDIVHRLDQGEELVVSRAGSLSELADAQPPAAGEYRGRGSPAHDGRSWCTSAVTPTPEQVGDIPQLRLGESIQKLPPVLLP